MLTLSELFADPPRPHRGETESSRVPAPENSVLDADAIERLNRGEPVSYGVSLEVGRFIVQNVREDESTMETGCGVSTLVFALAGARHVCVTPREDEVACLRRYARERGVLLERVEFVVADSADALPSAGSDPLDVVLVDGKHAFPWPILDWFYTARRLRNDGLMIVDDRQLPAVAMVERFLASSPGWDRVESPDTETAIFRKAGAHLDEVPWHAQVGLFDEHAPDWPVRSFLRRLRQRLGF